MSFNQTYEEALEKALQRPRRPRKPLTSKSTLKRSHRSTRAKRKPKRKRVATRKSLIKKIDGLVFEIVCLRYPCCVECGSGNKPTTGHVLSRRSFSTRWDFRNVFRQCWPCNYKAAMTAAASYHLWYVKTFGIAEFERLYQDWAKGRKYSRLELEVVAQEFEKELNNRLRLKEDPNVDLLPPHRQTLHDSVQPNLDTN